ncbi:DNA methyltransferase [Marilutibacter alkalisoli]|uniref:DNA methyltransferase n=1 Tax=Marilutibacter alkalisoli TaxID=2591633 RepID=UPI001FC967F3|nr:DNA methyltransferase [Lysobacter alkalisoli]
MDDASWFAPSPDRSDWELPRDIRDRDVFGGSDCGWVEQMRPFIRHFSQPRQTVLDPFCGFATTLLAAGIEGRRGIGFEIDPQRAALARERLQRHGVDADIRTGPLSHEATEVRADLCLTSVPYFGCSWNGEAVQGQLYLERDYAGFLSGLRAVFHAVRRSLADDGFCIAMAENIVVGGRRFQLAWDVARILDSLYVAHEERVLCYPRSVSPLPHAATSTNRSHEYALVYQKRRETIDLQATLEILRAIEGAGFDFRLHGSFAAWLEAGMPAHGRRPADADLLLPPRQDRLDALLRWLVARGFELNLWGEPVKPPVDLPTWQAHHYVRADRRGRDGSLVRLDLGCASVDAF